MDHDGTVRRPLARRLSRALAEAAADPAALVIVSGGSVDGRPAEAPIMRDWLVAQGLDPARILVEAEARSTAENARYCVDLSSQEGSGALPWSRSASTCCGHDSSWGMR